MLSKSILLLFMAVGCVPGKVTVRSIPDNSEVVVVNSSGEKKVLGTTPLEVKTSDLFRTDDYSTKLIVQKPGMYRESLVIPRNILTSDHQIQVTLSELEKVEIEKIVGEECKGKVDISANTRGDFSKLAQGVANVQSLLVKKEYGNAETQLSSLIATYPYVAVLHTLLGNSRFLQRDYTDAAKAYTRSLELDPDNIETKNILTKIASFTGSNRSNDEGN